MEPIQTTQGKAGHPHTPSNCKRFHPTPSPPVTEGPGSEAPCSPLRPSQPRSQQPVCASLQSDSTRPSQSCPLSGPVAGQILGGAEPASWRPRVETQPRARSSPGSPAPPGTQTRWGAESFRRGAFGSQHLLPGTQLQPVGRQGRPPAAAKLPNFTNRKARLLALRQGRARLRQCDATQFWREKRCTWIPAVAGRGRPGEKGGGWGRQGVCRGVRGPH